jgi:hypothetical protein
MTVRDASLVTAECDYSVVDVANNSTTVYTGKCLYFGATVTTVLSAHALPILDGANTIDSFAASSAVGAAHIFLHGVRCETGIVVDPNDAATGNVTVFYRPINTVTA